VRVFSYTSGIMMGLAWWIFIDACNVTRHYHPDALQVKAQLYLPGIGSTISFFIIAFMDWGALNADEYSYHGGKMVRYQARALLIFAILLSITCISLAGWALSDVYIDKNGIKGVIPESDYGGVAVLLQCILIFVASFVMRFARVNEDYI